MPKRVLSPQQVAARRRRNQIRRARRSARAGIRVAGVAYPAARSSPWQQYVRGANNTRAVSAAMNNGPPPVPSRANKPVLRRAQGGISAAGGIGSPGIAMSPAAKAYTACLLDCMTHPPCAMPIGGLESMPVRCFSKGTFTIGSTIEAGGYPGFICVDWTNACFSNVTPGYCSESTYVTSPPAFSYTAGTPTGVIALGTSVTNSPFATTALGAGALKYRLVAGLLRIRLLSTVNNVGGQTVVYTAPQHSNIAGMSMSTVLADPSSGQEIIDVDNNWITCIYNGVKQPYEQVFAGAVNSLPVSGILINGVVAGATFMWEIYTAVEFISTGASLTPSSTDVNGMEAAHTGVNRAMVEHPGTHGDASFFRSALTAVGRTIADNSSTFGSLFSDVAKSSAVKKFLTDALPVVGKAAHDIKAVAAEDHDVGLATARALGW